MSIYNKGSLKIEIECNKSQFADIKKMLLSNKDKCIFREWDEVPNCYGVNCSECFHAYFKRKLSEDEKEQIRKQNNKPPLGIIPYKLWIEERKNELKKAIQRYLDDDREIPIEWIDEYNTIKNI